MFIQPGQRLQLDEHEAAFHPTGPSWPVSRVVFFSLGVPEVSKSPNRFIVWSEARLVEKKSGSDVQRCRKTIERGGVLNAEDGCSPQTKRIGYEILSSISCGDTQRHPC